MKLSELVEAEGYRFVVVGEPHKEPNVLGDPPKGGEFFSALMCRGADGAPYIACIGDYPDHVYSCSHEIAEYLCGHRHSQRTSETQANILARWLRKVM